MFIAHAPAGYLVTKLVLHHFKPHADRDVQMLLRLGILASILPDIDMLYFYLIDHRQHHHHSYWTHLPFWWFIILAAGICCCVVANRPCYRQSVQIVALNVTLHFLLDTVAGKIRWFAPFSQMDIGLVDVPARYGWWVWNFLSHWTFGIELFIVGLALYAGRTHKFMLACRETSRTHPNLFSR